MFDDNEFDGFTLGELFAEADAIGRKYQSQEEIEDYQACLDGATEALNDAIDELNFDA